MSRASFTSHYAIIFGLFNIFCLARQKTRDGRGGTKSNFIRTTIIHRNILNPLKSIKKKEIFCCFFDRKNASLKKCYYRLLYTLDYVFFMYIFSRLYREFFPRTSHKHLQNTYKSATRYLLLYGSSVASQIKEKKNARQSWNPIAR